MYWSTDSLFSIYSEVMGRDRFFQLLKFLHFADNSAYAVSDPYRDKLFKIRELCEMFRERCKTVYIPGQNVCVDESLVLFKGRLAFKQFIRTKRARFGIKIYQLCTSSGITLGYRIYHGDMSKELASNPELLTTENIVMSLMEGYTGKGRVVYLDNFYTTPSLATKLLDIGTLMVGTVRLNRKNSQQILLKPGQRKVKVFFMLMRKKA